MAARRRVRSARLLRACFGAAAVWLLVLAALNSGLVFASAALPSRLLSGVEIRTGNVNGMLFQGSLPPYLVFIYFLGYRGNNTPPLALFGFTFLLAFVASTVVGGIISKSAYGLALADSDWIHGTAEALLTCTNIMIVLGFRAALTGNREMADSPMARTVALTWLGATGFFLASGVGFWGFQAHSRFLAGVGALDASSLTGVAEPVNAVSIPNWIIHWSCVFDFLLAMSLVWRYAGASGNPRWKGLTWGMFPCSVSSICALTNHIFYNQIPWILTAQAVFTFIGNITLGIAAFRVAVSNGWTTNELDPRRALGRTWEKLTGRGHTSADTESGERANFHVGRVTAVSSEELTPGSLLIWEGVLLTVVFSYGTKYGELVFGSSVWQSPDSSAAAAAVILIPASIVFYTICSNSPDIRSGRLPPLAFSVAATQEG